MKYEQVSSVIHIWTAWFCGLEWRVELNPLSWHVGFSGGELGLRIDFLCVGFGVTWGAANSRGKTREDIERQVLADLKEKYERT